MSHSVGGMENKDNHVYLDLRGLLGWFVGWLAGWLGGWVAGRLVGW